MKLKTIFGYSNNNLENKIIYLILAMGKAAKEALQAEAYPDLFRF